MATQEKQKGERRNLLRKARWYKERLHRVLWRKPREANTRLDRSLSKTLCQEFFGVEIGFEALTEALSQGGQVSLDAWVHAVPFGFIELVDQEFHFDEGFPFGVEVAAGIAVEVFDLVVETFREVGRTQMRVEWGGIFQEGQVVGGAFFEGLDVVFVVGAESVQELAQFGLGAFETAGGVDFPPSVFEGGVILGAQVALGVAE